jgi:hypothetical protein
MAATATRTSPAKANEYRARRNWFPSPFHRSQNCPQKDGKHTPGLPRSYLYQVSHSKMKSVATGKQKQPLAN